KRDVRLHGNVLRRGDGGSSLAGPAGAGAARRPSFHRRLALARADSKQRKNDTATATATATTPQRHRATEVSGGEERHRSLLAGRKRERPFPCASRALWCAAP